MRGTISTNSTRVDHQLHFQGHQLAVTPLTHPPSAVGPRRTKNSMLYVPATVCSPSDSYDCSKRSQLNYDTTLVNSYTSPLFKVLFDIWSVYMSVALPDISAHQTVQLMVL
jgi:hypothetical protein